jgi:hypothetical protein
MNKNKKKKEEEIPINVQSDKTTISYTRTIQQETQQIKQKQQETQRNTMIVHEKTTREKHRKQKGRK